MVLLYYVFIHHIITLQKAIYIYVHIDLPSPKTIRMKVLYDVIRSSIIFIAEGYIYIYIYKYIYVYMQFPQTTRLKVL